MSRHKIWLLKLILPFKYGRWVTGLLLLAVLLPFFYLGAPRGDGADDGAPALFFSLIIAYLIPVFSFITERSLEALDELRPVLDLDEESFAEARSWLDSSPVLYTVMRLLLGTLAAMAHISFINGSVAAGLSHSLASISSFMTALGTLMVWITMTTVITILTQQCVVFGRLGARNVRLALFNNARLVPFARVSISSSLAIIGALALFPLISFEGPLDLAEIVPGAVATLLPLIVMLVLPVWPVHLRLLRLKNRELAVVNAEIDAHVGVEDGAGDSLREVLLPMLAYRREIALASTWPFDIGNITRFAFYLIIPPLTWAGAALIENLVDALL